MSSPAALREKADEVRQCALGIKDPTARAELLAIADLFERLALSLEWQADPLGRLGEGAAHARRDDKVSG